MNGVEFGFHFHALFIFVFGSFKKFIWFGVHPSFDVKIKGIVFVIDTYITKNIISYLSK